MKTRLMLSVFIIWSSIFAFAGSSNAAVTLNPAGLSYRSIGPAISGGRTSAVAGSDVDPFVYFAGGADGGVFKSSDGGSVWTPIFDKADAAAIGAIATAPDDPKDIWVGTGESNPRNDVAMGDGIWHSSDGGKTWKHLGLDEAGAISAISIDPSDPRIVVVGVLGQIFRDSSTRGIYRTTDGGAHWTRELFLGPETGVSDLIRLPNRPQTLLAGLWQVRRLPWTLRSGGLHGGIYRSDDGGKTWRRLVGNGLPAGPTGRIGLAASSGGRVYAIIQSRAGDLWRSDDFGATWRLMPHSPLVGPRPFYFSSITADPADPNKLISVGLNLSMTTDGGRTFKRISSNAGWDYHIVWWSHDGKRIAVGSDEGLVLSSDGGTTWRQPYNLPFAQAYHVGFDAAQPNYHVCIGLQDDGVWCGAANSDSGLGVLNRDWSISGVGDGMWAEYDPLDPHLVWSTTTSSDTGQVYLFDTRTQQAYEVSPDSRLNYIPPYLLKYRFNWDTPLTFTADGKVLVGGNVVFESADRGQHWSIISPDLTRNVKAHQQATGGPIDYDFSGAETSDNILCLATSPVDASTFWAGTDDGLVWVTRDRGSHWSNVTPHGAPYWGRMMVEPGRFDAATAFVAVDNHMLGDDGPHLFETRDGGASWHSISGDLPASLFVRSVRQDPVNSNLLYAGTNRGMWASWDGGVHWRSLRLNMPATAVYDIEIQPQTDDLVVATHGRGVWILDDLGALQHASSSQASTVALFAPRDTYRWWQWSPINSFKDSSLPANIFHGPNVDYGALITYWLAASSHKKAEIDILDSRGRLVRRLDGRDVTTQRGFNRVAWDLTENPPVKWLGTFKDNQGPSTGAEVIPGTYTVRLHVDGVTQEQKVVVKADPRDPLPLAGMQARYRILTQLYGQVSDVDSMLNAIDKQLRAKISPSRRAALALLKTQLTTDPKNVEDLSVISTPLRDQLLDLISRISGSSFQPPTQSQLQAAAALHQIYTKLVRTYHSLM
jgi:photosystem II stability/assembly factor-like uncharacterized protein